MPTLDSPGKVDTLLIVPMADDVAADANRVRGITVRVLLSDPAAQGLPDSERLEPVTVATIAHPGNGLENIPPANGIADHIELRLNAALLGRPIVDQGWLVFTAQPNLFAVGNNLVGLRVTDRPRDAPGEISIEKLEVHVSYR